MKYFTRLIAAAAALHVLPRVHASQFVLYTPMGDDTVVERADPILHPGKIGAHVHQILGAANFAPNLDYDMLQKSTCTTISSASGDGVSQDKSAYWHPSLFMKSSTGTGHVRIPTNGHKIYYRDIGNAADKKADPFEFPPGFRMVAGDKFMRAANSDVKRQSITEWSCYNHGQNKGDKGGFPSGVTDCATYPGLHGNIHFPHCWNGKDFDQSDPSAHVSYPVGDVQGGPCPSSHPIRVPHIFMENQFDLHKVVDKVQPGTFVLSQGDPTGFGLHADFFNGWDAGAIPKLMNSCPQGPWGNADIGTCSAFKKGSTKGADCKLKGSFKENVDTPDVLPGCNPIVSTNPAPKLAVAALGQATTDCSAAGNNSAAPPAYKAPPSSSTTLATTSTPSAGIAAAGVVTIFVYETVYSPIFAREAAPTPAPHGHNHAQHARRHGRKHL